MNLPEPFLERVTRQIGDETQRLVAAHSQSSPVSLRIHTGKFERSVGLEPVPWSSSGYYLPDRPIFTVDPLLHAGCYYVQEASSMLLEQAILQVGGDEPDLRVLDLCAAPGGKSTHLMQLLHPKSLLVSNEVIRSRVWILAENICKRSGTNVVVSNNDPADFQTLTGLFDILVVDAPCSGEGLFRKEEASLQQWSPDQLTHCAQRQQRILLDAIPSLSVGGHLIYSTCTFNPGENEEIVRWLVAEQGFEVVSLDLDPAWGFQELEVNGEAVYQAYPHRVKGEGFFLALLRKVSGSERRQPAKRKKPKKQKPASRKSKRGCQSCEVEEPANNNFAYMKATRRIQKPVKSWLKETEIPQAMLVQHETLSTVAANLVDDILELSTVLKLVQAGVPTAEMKPHGSVPLHGLALSLLVDRQTFASVDLDLPTALRYLRREPIETTLPDGVGLVCYRGFPLGWVKQIGPRSNNWYPREWRIRMPVPEEKTWSLCDV